MYRTGSYNEMLSRKLHNKEFAHDYILSLMENEDGLSLFDALKHTINQMGIKEFSIVSGIPEKSVSRMLHTLDLPKLETLDKYFAPFGLKVRLYLVDVA
jgi:DNA-binding phage protein